MKTWFITGASRGFGALSTQAVLASGDAVVATARDASSIPDHPQLLKLSLDVTNEGQARDAAARAIAKFGRIDILVNNAGYGLLGAIEEASAVEVERVFATNVFGLLNVTRAVLPYMRKQRSGHVINMSSIGGYASSSGWGIYCASKFAVEGSSGNSSPSGTTDIDRAISGIHRRSSTAHTPDLPEMLNHLTGGCMCGAVRYRISAAPIVAGLCHCNRCQGQQ